ncbi:MAG: NUDIX domain-containing protein [Thermoplasmata archaeon]|nr:NUDIX domain-containing protein [Thermoplasmata archaeon]
MTAGLRGALGVKAVIIREDRALILRRSRRSPTYAGFWDLPGGYVEHGETLEEAVVREVLEETSLAARVGRVVDVYEAVGKRGRGKSILGVGVTYVCSSQNRRMPRLRPQEHSAFAWVPRADLPRYRMPDMWKKGVRMAFAAHEM